MKRFVTMMLSLMLTLSPVLAEQMAMPTPPADSFEAEMSDATLDDVLDAWLALPDNQDAYALLESNAQTLAPETLLRVLMTYCMQVNPDTTCEIMLDYEPMIAISDSRITITVMTHAVGFTLVLDAYTGECTELQADADGGNG